MSAPPAEPLPEYPHQLSVHHIDKAIQLIDAARNAPSDRDKVNYLKRADAAIGYARDSARSIAARWRDYNHRARDLGAWLVENERQI